MNQGSYHRGTVADLVAALDAIVWSPEGVVAGLFETPRSGRHLARPEVVVVAGKGFAGDHPRKSFYRGAYVPGREVSAVSLEVLRVLGVDPAVVGDNLITAGLDLRVLEPGDVLAVGEEVRLRRSDRPHQVCTVFRDRTSPEAFAAIGQGRYRGALFVVERGGRIRLGDPIRRCGSGMPRPA
ncbi:MOSC domain-containing protein [Rhodocaloribacter litoris]|uniref:MOSC domain-containing protein n=1 Tax=Rhodocaloribacter litoris TaxID=2558931 RepID=UPI001E38E4FA|nr:MOSC domain-containing protein [Rhodocaloribacter litoris]